VLRSDAGAVYRAASADFGLTWGPAHRTSLRAGNSGLDAAALGTGGLLAVAYNPHPVGTLQGYGLRVRALWGLGGS